MLHLVGDRCLLGHVSMRTCPLPPLSHAQLFLVSEARRVAELIQCLAKGLCPGHKPLGCQHPGGVS